MNRDREHVCFHAHRTIALLPNPRRGLGLSRQSRTLLRFRRHFRSDHSSTFPLHVKTSTLPPKPRAPPGVGGEKPSPFRANLIPNDSHLTHRFVGGYHRSRADDRRARKNARGSQPCGWSGAHSSEGVTTPGPHGWRSPAFQALLDDAGLANRPSVVCYTPWIISETNRSFLQVFTGVLPRTY